MAIDHQLDQALSAKGMSRRQVLIGLAAAAATYSMPGWAADVVSASASASASTSTPNWPLWEVSNGKGKVYLTGETPPRATAWQDQRIEKLVLGCSTFWTETSQIHGQPSQALIKQYGIDTSTPLMSKLSKVDQDRVIKVAGLANVPVDSLGQFRPWVVASQLEQEYYGKMNLQESGVAEKVLTPLAQKAGVALASEFPAQDDVITFMGQMSQQEEIQYLQYTLDHILDGSAENERIYALWAHGDASGAEGMVKRMQATQPDLYKKHVIERNRNWIPRVDKMLTEKKPALIVAGLYHMAGPDSLLVRLKEQGWKVVAV